MTAQTTARTPAAGTRVAPMFVVLIAIVAFAAGLALAQVIAPVTASSAAAADQVTVVPDAAQPATAPAAGTWPGVFRNPSIDDVSGTESDPATTIGVQRVFAEDRNR